MVLLSPRRAVVHVDLDGARHIYRVHGWSFPPGSDSLFESGLEGALGFLSEQAVTATFFAIAEDLDDPRKRELLHEIVRRGHEIGSHTITHRRLTGLDPAERRREIRDSRLRLEDALGVPVQGFRAPVFDCDAGVLAEVANASYRYDSSLAAGTAARAIGRGDEPIDAGPFAIDEAGTIEIPLPGRAGLPLPFHPSYSLVLGTWYFRRGFARAGRSPVFVLLFHLTDFAGPLEPAVLQPRGSRLFTLSHLSAETKRARCGAMLDLVRRTHEIVPTMSLLDASVEATARGSHS